MGIIRKRHSSIPRGKLKQILVLVKVDKKGGQAPGFMGEGKEMRF